MRLAAYILNYWRPRTAYVEALCSEGWTVRNFIPRAWFEFLAFILHGIMAAYNYNKYEEGLFVKTVLELYGRKEER